MRNIVLQAVTWIAVLLAVMVVWAGFAYSQEAENDLCAPVGQMHNAMLGQGYLNVFEGLVDTDEVGTITLKLYVHPKDGDWMVHAVNLVLNQECHLDGGPQYMAPKIGELL